MLQLIKKEITTQRKVAYMAPLMLLPYFIGIGNDVGGTPLIIVLIFSMSIAFIGYFMVLYSNFSTNEGEKIQFRLLLSLPVNRYEIVLAKYATILFWWLVAFTSYVILFFVAARFFNYKLGNSLDYRAIPLSLCFTYILSSVYYPLQFKFGYRIASFIGILLFFAITTSVGKIFSIQSDFFSIISSNPTVSIIVFTILASVLSLYISLRILQKKDY